MNNFVYRDEFGTTQPVRFLTPENITVYDSEGKEIQEFCKCGKKAISFLQGKDVCFAYCYECLQVSSL